MTSHFSFALKFAFYIALYAGSCANKNNKKPNQAVSIQDMPLTENIPAKIKAALSKNPDKVVSTIEFIEFRHNRKVIDRIEITQRDLMLLQGSNWLNDNIIKAYMLMINNRSKKKKSSLPKVYGFDPLFYTTLSEPNYEYTRVKRWNKGIDIFAYDRLLVPIHLKKKKHWCLAVIDFGKKEIVYYDSLGGDNQTCLDNLLSYLTDKSEGKINKDHWKLECLKDIPRQQNGYDCGVFVCTFADYAARDAKIYFNQDNMPYFRNRIAIEILEGKLMGSS